MKVLIVNGSPHELNSTSYLVSEYLCEKFNEKDIESRAFNLDKGTPSCIACRKCKRSGTCIISGDVGEFSEMSRSCNGIIFVTPVYYGGISGQMNGFLTRLFYSSPKLLMYKPVSSVVISRRSGSTSAFNRMNMFFLMHSMVVVGSQYWNEIYSDDPSEFGKDEEGIQTLDTLVDNMEYVMKGLSLVDKPIKKKYIHTNFIRE